MIGALLVDKPAGPTSHDIVAFVRRTLQEPRAGHTGTLDPLATGLLIVLVGQATRLAQFLAADEKEYVADVRLGIATPTYDAASLEEAGGQRLEVGKSAKVTEEQVEAVLNRFRGTFLQTPPPFSAKKIASVPAYEKARKNQPVDLKPVSVTVRQLYVLPPFPTSNLQPPTSVPPPLRLRVAASAGFYVRSLAHDIGQALGCGAHLEALRRTRAGQFRVEDALTLDRVEASGASAVTPVNTLLADMPSVTLPADGARRAAHGNPIQPEKGDRSLFASGKGDRSLFRLLDADGTLIAVAEARPDGLLHPLVVLR